MRSWLGLLVCASALAQNTSDLQPAAPAAPAGTIGGSYMPGMPYPVIPPTAEPAPADKPKDRGGYYVYDDNVGGEEDEVTVTPSANGTHVVRRGDTLWGLSATYFRNPWYWPKLWALNPSITNPHWIYPGDILKLSSAPEENGTSQVEPKNETPKLSGRHDEPTLSGLFLRQNGFVEPGELEKAATIIGSKEEKIMLATLDDAYAQYSEKQPLEVGQKYSIYKPIRTVKHPQTGKRLGEIVEIFGEAVVKSVTDGKIARMTITDSTDTIERGYKVGILRRTFKRVAHKNADRDLAGVIVDTLRPVELVGAGILVFIDRGERDGVALGNRFQIVRRGDGYQPLLWRGQPMDDKRFPREVVGDLEVVDLRDRIATGWVLSTAKEARIGDRVELHQGE